MSQGWVLNRDQILREVFGWRSTVEYQIINSDIDGLLTGALLWEKYGWPILGIYDTKTLWISRKLALPLDLPKIAWVDCDMLWPGMQSLSQHVVTESAPDREQVLALGNSVNPSLLAGNSQSDGYTWKYPYGTFQWAWWLLLDTLPPAQNVQTGLAWMPDGGFGSVHPSQHMQNCLQWGMERLPGSILAPFAQRIKESGDPHNECKILVNMVKESAEHMQRITRSDKRDWPNYQFKMTRPAVLNLKPPRFGKQKRGPEPRNKYLVPDVAAPLLDRILKAICAQFGWTSKDKSMPTQYRSFTGDYFIDRRFPLGWPDAANHHQIASLAVTYGNTVCWTEPGSGPDSLLGALRR